MSLWEQITKAREVHENPYDELEGYADWTWHREEEQSAEMPGPLCCPDIAQYPVVRGFVSHDDAVADPDAVPRWVATAAYKGDDTDAAEVKFCPFCATPLPSFRKKDPPPPQLWGPDDYYCQNCKERNMNCVCSLPGSNWEADNAPEVKAVTALIRRYVATGDTGDTKLGRERVRGEVIGVARKNAAPDDLGFPGGKIEPGETPYEAMVREVREETGIEVKAAHLAFDALDDAKTRVWMYHVTKYEGEGVTTEPDCPVRWGHPKMLLGGTFGRFNEGVFRRLRILMHKMWMAGFYER